MSNHVTNTFYNILQGHYTSQRMALTKTLTHTNKHLMKTIKIHEDTLLFMSSRMSIDEYKS